MPSLQQLRYLVAIADTAHFSRAAERCHVSQPTLSGQLKELERRLAGQLVERDRKAKVILTPLGREVVARARRILRDVEDIKDLARRGGPHPVGTIRLGAVPTLGAYFLSLVVPDLHLTFPELRLFVREAGTESLLSALDDGQLDALLVPLPVRGEHLETTPLLREPLLAVVAADHPLARASSVGPADLRGQTVLALEPGHRLHAQVEELCAQVGAKVARDFEGTSLDTLRLMVGMGLGLTFLPALYVRTEALKDPAVRVLPFLPDAPVRQIGLVWRKRSARTEAFLTLAERMRQVLEDSVAGIEVQRPG
ncbi:MAG: LysR family transcriptional regulator [Geminicoccaceae bacterium]|nr:MAG: LysR family transcriptional regulator [Geminicoccaceae bacterium]